MLQANQEAYCNRNSVMFTFTVCNINELQVHKYA